MSPGPHAARGFSLVVAIFVLLVLAALGAFAVKVGVSQDQTATLDLLAARAQAAADSGIEYGANRALKNPTSCPSGGTTTYPTLNLTTPGLSGFRVTVTCTSTPHAIFINPTTSKNYNVYDLVSIAQRGTYGTPDFVSRTVRRSVNDSPLP